MTPELTDAQRHAIEQAFEILGEHFESFVLAAEYQDDNELTDIHISYSGFFAALGLVTLAQHRMKQMEVNEEEDAPDPEDE